MSMEIRTIDDPKLAAWLKGIQEEIGELTTTNILLGVELKAAQNDSVRLAALAEGLRQQVEDMGQTNAALKNRFDAQQNPVAKPSPRKAR
jgi:hypothetical protein